MREVEVSAIIVSYRSAALTIEALRSLEAEQSPGIRLRAVVVDNASGDLPAIGDAVAASGWSSWVTLVDAPRNGGFAYGNNLGIRRAYAGSRPDYIYLLNPDAEARAGAIGALVRFMQTHPDAGIAGSSFENPDGSSWPLAFRFPGLASEFNEGLQLGIVRHLLAPWVVARVMPQDAPSQTDWICGASMLIRPEVLAAIGGMDENYFLYYEETDFCHRARQAGFTTWYVPESRVMHHCGQSTGVTARSERPKRLPAYWFESRRRYFARTFGAPYAMLIDLAAFAAHALGRAKRYLQGRSHDAPPHFLQDFASNSILRPRNRHMAPVAAGALQDLLARPVTPSGSLSAARTE